MVNLDYLCARRGLEIGTKEDRTVLQKALGVLKEDGIYAMFLFLEKETKNKDTRKILSEMLNDQTIKNQLLPDGKSFGDDFKEFCETLIPVMENIDKVFFLEIMLERVLTYALYHAKIKGE